MTDGAWLCYLDVPTGATARCTPTIEGFWSIIKRGIVGTFHNVSKKYLHLYVAEFQFRYNNRFNDDIFGTAIEAA
jgi:ISXO2-like transposase domain